MFELDLFWGLAICIVGLLGLVMIATGNDMLHSNQDKDES